LRLLAVRSDDFEAFCAVIGDVCAAYDRPVTDARNRTFWDVLKGFHLHDIKRAADKWKHAQRKMPAPVDLKPERSTAPAKSVESADPSMSRWAAAANSILLAVAYFDERRGFHPIGVWERMPEKGWGLPLRQPRLIDVSLIHRVMAVKADYARMAEQAEADGEPWDRVEFNRMCREGFEKLLTPRVAA
jgi:hypothetical protein